MQGLVSTERDGYLGMPPKPEVCSNLAIGTYSMTLVVIEVQPLLVPKTLPSSDGIEVYLRRRH